MCQVLQEYDVDVWLKWPNDIYVGHKKIAGILTEAATQYGMLDRIVVGIGINISLSADDVPPAIRNHVTSIAIENEREIDRMELALDLQSRLTQIVGAYSRSGLEALSSFVARFDRSRGKNVRLPDGEEGQAVGIANDGAFEVEIGGTLRRVTTGEVTFLWDEET